MLNNNFKKIDLIKKLSSETGFSSNLSKKLINDFIQIIIVNIKTGYLNLKNIGTFKIINKKRLKIKNSLKDNFS